MIEIELNEEPQPIKKENKLMNLKFKYSPLLKKMFIEMICTMIFVFVVNSNHIENKSLIASCIGSTLTSIVLIFLFSKTSGSHFNPAVTIAFFIRRRLEAVECVMYILSQLLGSTLANALLLCTYPKDIFDEITINPSNDDTLIHTFMIEMTRTFILIFIVLCCAFSKMHTGKSSIIIGLTVGFLVLMGGTFNTALVFANVLFSSIWNGHWLYWISNVIGSSLGSLLNILFCRLDLLTN